jgi:hypothetical protein
MNAMRKYFALLLASLVMSVVIGIVSAQEAAEVPVPITVEGAEMAGIENGTYLLHVVGSLGTGCDLPVMIDQHVDDDTLYVDIYQSVPVDLFCTLMLIPYDEIIPLHSDEPFDQVVVNDLPIGFIASSAPTPETVEPTKVFHQIESVGLGGPTSIRVTGFQTDSCQFPVMIDQSFNDGWFTIEIYRYIPPNVRCAGEMIPFSETISLEALELLADMEPQAGVEWTLEVNDYLAIWTPFAGASDDNGTPVAILIPTTLQPAERDPMTIDSATVTTTFTETGSQLALNVSGSHPDGCLRPVTARQMLDGDTIMIQIYRASPIDVATICPAMFIYFNERIPIDLDLAPGTYNYDVNGVTGVLTVGMEGQESLMNRVPHIINDVSVRLDDTTTPPSVTLDVSGFVPDGCEAQTHIDIRSEDDETTVEIYREIPPGVDCPEIAMEYNQSISLGEIPPETRTITVNGVSVDIDLSD